MASRAVAPAARSELREHCALAGASSSGRGRAPHHPGRALDLFLREKAALVRLSDPAASGAGVSKDVLDGLTAEQRDAETHGDGPLLIVAGAGTGKTTVLTRRIAYLITTRRARPEEVLALTFTDRAAAEMEERVDRLVPYGYTQARHTGRGTLRALLPDGRSQPLLRNRRQELSDGRP